MLCDDIECSKRDSEGGCTVYPPGGMAMRDRLNYCPVVDMPRKQVGLQAKQRQGQQKQKTKKK